MVGAIQWQAAGRNRAESVSWPADRRRRAELAACGVPRLLVVADGATPPPMGQDEDWIRASADEQDAWARLRHLVALHERRSARQTSRRATADDQPEERPWHIS